MRPFLKVVAGTVAAVLLAASGPGQAATLSPRRVRIVTSFLPVFVMVENVAGGVEGVSIRNLAAPQTGCLHDVALTTEDMRVLSAADIFVVNGAGMEGYLDRVAGQFPGLKVVRLSDGLSLLRDAGGRVNAHLWVSPTGVLAQVKNLVDGLSLLDPDRAAAYRENGRAYRAKLEALRLRMKTSLASRARAPVVTFHEAFGYFAREFDFEVAAVIEREPGTTPGARDLAATIDLVRRRGVKVLFVEPQYPSDVAWVVAQETGARVYVLDPAVTGSDDKDAYLRVMEKNLSVLEEAFPEA